MNEIGDRGEGEGVFPLQMRLLVPRTLQDCIWEWYPQGWWGFIRVD
jgi:hypothetical protein